jgi:hypothetical protein
MDETSNTVPQRPEEITAQKKANTFPEPSHRANELVCMQHVGVVFMFLQC